MDRELKTCSAAGLLACCFPFMAAAEPVKMPLDKLYATAIEDVPEQVHVTDMLDYYGRVRLDALVHILEEVPEHWEVLGGGRLSVSDEYSKAGWNSIRWDWKAGDVIRIKDLGVARA